MSHTDSPLNSQLQAVLNQGRAALASGDFQTAMSLASQALSLAQQGRSAGNWGHPSGRASAFFDTFIGEANQITTQAQTGFKQQQEAQQAKQSIAQAAAPTAAGGVTVMTDPAIAQILQRLLAVSEQQALGQKTPTVLSQLQNQVNEAFLKRQLTELQNPSELIDQELKNALFESAAGKIREEGDQLRKAILERSALSGFVGPGIAEGRQSLLEQRILKELGQAGNVASAEAARLGLTKQQAIQRGAEFATEFGMNKELQAFQQPFNLFQSLESGRQSALDRALQRELGTMQESGATGRTRMATDFGRLQLLSQPFPPSARERGFTAGGNILGNLFNTVLSRIF